MELEVFDQDNVVCKYKRKRKKREKEKERKSKNRISCQDQGVSWLNTKGLFRIKGILVRLSFECE